MPRLHFFICSFNPQGIYTRILIVEPTYISTLETEAMRSNFPKAPQLMSEFLSLNDTIHLILSALGGFLSKREI